MPHGVKRSVEEIESIKARVLELMHTVPGATFGGSCKVAGVSVPEAYNWRKEDKEFDRAVYEGMRASDDLAVDLAQSKLIQKIHEGTLKAITYFLDRKGGDRGYNPKQIVDVNPGIIPEPDTTQSPEELLQIMSGLRRLT